MCSGSQDGSRTRRGDWPPEYGASPQRWLLISVSLTAGQASLRVHVWRKLRSLGAVYLQASVCLLPERPEVVQQVRRLIDRVHHEGGSARVLQVALPETGEEQALREEFNTARDTEYAEVLERLPALSAEIAMEGARGRATYAEVEESEADLERFRSWLAKIAARDYSQHPVVSGRGRPSPRSPRSWRPSKPRRSTPKPPPITRPALRSVPTSRAKAAGEHEPRR